MPESLKKSLTIIVYFVLTLSILLVFWQVRNFDFLNYDDNLYVYENPQVLNGLTFHGVVWAFTTGKTGYWHPLTWLSFMLDCQLFGANAGRIHLVSVFLHILNTLLLFAFLKKMTRSLWPSAFVAAAFALHPMHVQSVAWVAERKDMLSTLFLLLTLTVYVGYVRRRSLFRYLLTILLFALGLLAKPMLVTLPFILLLLDYWPLNRFEVSPEKTLGGKSRKPLPPFERRTVLYRILIEKIPLFILSAVSSVITFLAQQASGIVADINILPFYDRIANAFLSYAKYIGKMFWPQNLAVFYPLDTGSIRIWQVALCALLLLVITVFVIRFRQNQKYLLVGWFWFVGTLIPVIGLVQVGTQSLADRYTYIPYIGLFLMIACGIPELLSRWPYRKIVLGISMMIALMAMGICAVIQVSYWHNSTMLFSHAIEVTQNNYVAHLNLGDALRRQGKLDEALNQFLVVLRLQPNSADAHDYLGIALQKEGRFADALAHFNMALKLTPDSPPIHLDFGTALLEDGRVSEAIEQFNIVLKTEPYSAKAHNNLGYALLQQGKLDEAVGHLRQAVQIHPDFPEAHNNLGIALKRQDKFAQALAEYTQSLRLKPDQPSAMSNLAFLIATHPEIENRDVNEAVRLATRACELTSYKNPVFVCTLAAAYASAGRFSEAVDIAQKAINLAEAAGQPQAKNLIQYQLTFYRRGIPYTEQVTNKP
jgi:Flp pilus assembly protein TadD